MDISVADNWHICACGGILCWSSARLVLWWANASFSKYITDRSISLISACLLRHTWKLGKETVFLPQIDLIKYWKKRKTRSNLDWLKPNLDLWLITLLSQNVFAPIPMGVDGEACKCKHLEIYRWTYIARFAHIRNLVVMSWNCTYMRMPDITCKWWKKEKKVFY